MIKRLNFLNVLLLILLFFYSCSPDEEPTTDNRSKLEAAWKCDENSPSFGNQKYYVEIKIDPNSDNYVIIDNFFNLGYGKSIIAKFSEPNLIITNQSISGYIFNGKGTVSSNYNYINWKYTFDEGNGPEEVTATYTKM